MERIVVKIGSNVLTTRDGGLDTTRMSAIVDQVSSLVSEGIQVVLVSSGAVASGRREISPSRRLDSVQSRQLFSAVGQVRLINRYYDLFRDKGITIGQVLTMKESFSTRSHYLNQRACIEVMLGNGVLPIVNENDTVSVTELMFTDNDELSGLVATMTGADLLVILTNVDGVYNGDPSEEGTSIIRRINPGEDLSGFVKAGRSEFGRGGMITKSGIASKLASEGIRVVIANGRRDNILLDILHDPDNVPFTEFVPGESSSGVKKWVAHSGGFAKGWVTIDRKARETLLGPKAASLLFVGVKSIEGDFEEGDILSIRDEDGGQIALGKSEFSSERAKALVGRHGEKPLVHYDFLFTEEES